MDTVVITVTVDCSMSYPGFKAMPRIDDVPSVAEEYVRSIDAGASLVHHHGVHRLEETIQADGRRLSRIDSRGLGGPDPAHPVRSATPSSSSASRARALTRRWPSWASSPR